jgi:hypothetical protein
LTSCHKSCPKRATAASVFVFASTGPNAA